MNTRRFACCSTFAILSTAVLAPHVCGAFTNGQNAVQVIGQPDFTSSATTPVETKPLNGADLVVDPVTGKLFVSSFLQNRVLRWANVDSLAPGAAPEAVLGQPDFTTVTAGLSATKMSFPGGLSIDSAGRLWVADGNNNRVIRFDGAANLPSGAAASGVLGQSNFTTNATGTLGTRMSLPVGVFVDPAGRLWVAENGNNRVTRFDNAATLANGSGANAVLGQAAFGVNAPATSQAGLNAPAGVAVSADGTLFITEYNNNRATVHINAAAKPNGAPADSVLGAQNFTSVGSGLQNNTFGNPYFPGVSPLGVLGIPDSTGSRGLLFESPTGIANGWPADVVIGKSFFTTSSPISATQSTTADVRAMKFDAAGRLWVLDNGNTRVLRFDPPSLVSGSFQPSISTSKSSKSKAIFQVSNSGPIAADFSLKAKFKITCGKAKVRLVYNGRNIAPAAKRGTALTGVLPPKGVAEIVVRANKKSSSSPGPVRIRTKLTARSVAYPSLLDVAAEPTIVD